MEATLLKHIEQSCKDTIAKEYKSDWGQGYTDACKVILAMIDMAYGINKNFEECLQRMKEELNEDEK